MVLYRVLLLKGLVHIFWRYLSPPVFQCVSDCDEEGTTLRALVKQQAGADIECCCFSPSGKNQMLPIDHKSPQLGNAYVIQEQRNGSSQIFEQRLINKYETLKGKDGL